MPTKSFKRRAKKTKETALELAQSVKKSKVTEPVSEKTLKKL